MNLFYAYLSDKKTEEERIKDYILQYKQERQKFKNNNLKFLMLEDRNTLENITTKMVWEEIEDYTKEGLNPKNIVFAFFNDHKKKTFSKKEMYNLMKITEILKPLGISVGIYDYQDVYDYHKVNNAQKILMNNVNAIKQLHYSPLEKLMHAYFVVARNRYVSATEEESESISRSVYGVLNSDKMVCSGYSELLKAVVKELDDENLKVFANDVAIKDKKDKKEKKVDIEFHQNNIVYIKDEKYNIDGFYYLDPTWDTSVDMETNEDLIDSVKHFLVEISQIKYVKEKNAIADFNENSGENFSLSESLAKNSSAVKKKDKFKFKNAVNLLDPTNASVSSDKADLEREFRNYRKNSNSDSILTEYLVGRKDFRDYVVLNQIEKDLKKKNSDFDVSLNNNIKKASKNIKTLNAIKDKKIIWNFLNEHSPHVAIGPIQTAMHKVFKNMYGGTKDAISALAYETLKYNIMDSKFMFDKKAKTALTECEDIK